MPAIVMQERLIGLIAGFTEQSEEETDFLVDRFRSGALFQPRRLVRRHGLFRDINGHHRTHMAG